MKSSKSLQEKQQFSFAGEKEREREREWMSEREKKTVKNESENVARVLTHLMLFGAKSKHFQSTECEKFVNLQLIQSCIDM